MSKKRAHVITPAKTFRVAATLVSITLIVAILRWAEVVLIPIALAILLTFILSPLVTRLDRLGLKRVFSVLVVVVVTGLLLSSLIWLVASQLHSLATDFPRYQDNIREKLATLRQGSKGGALEKVRSTLEGAAEKVEQEANGKEAAEKDLVASDPLLVRVVPNEGPKETLNAMLTSLLSLSPALQGLATAGLALVLLIFMLIKREDLRNRLVSFTAEGSLATTTKALDDVGQRISRYLIMQLIINGTFGMAVAAGLMIIQVPYAFLWGLCATVFRYIPYIGPWVAALLPITVSLITSPNWTQLLMVFALFLILELVSNNVMEPWLYGQGVGVSEVALLVSAAFWTWIWGAVGLVLATPLTVCLVVTGKYVPALAFLDKLLGDRPVLPPYAVFLQRLLAKDTPEASGIVRKYCEEQPAETVYDTVIVPALALARRERTRQTMNAEEESLVLQGIRTILDEMQSKGDDEQGTDAADAPEPTAALVTVLGYPARLEAEELTLHMVARLVRPMGNRVEVLSTHTLPTELAEMVQRDRPMVLVISVLPPGGLVQAHYLCKLLRKQYPDLVIVVGCWGFRGNLDRILVKLRSAGANYITTTLLGARDSIRSVETAAKQRENTAAAGSMKEPKLDHQDIVAATGTPA